MAAITLLFLLPSCSHFGSEMPGPATDRALPDGARVASDGVYYDYRAPDAVKHVRMWVPPGDSPVMGVLLTGNPGGIGGDSRAWVQDENMQALALRFNFALMATANFTGRTMYDEGAPVILDVLDVFADATGRPELANVPFVVFGNSNGAMMTWGFVNYVPERVIGFTMKTGSWFFPTEPTPGALKVPGMIFVGENDRASWITDTRAMIGNARPRGARWSWGILPGWGHSGSYAYSAYAKFYENVISLRYPDGVTPLDGPVPLRDLPEESGWLADQSSQETGDTYIAEYRGYERDRDAASWLPDKDTAFLYRALANYSPLLKLYPEDFGVAPGKTWSDVHNPGDRILLRYDASELPGWTKIVFYNGAVKLGEVTPGAPELTITVDAEPATYCVTALALTQDREAPATAVPAFFVVADPKAQARNEVAKAAALKSRKAAPAEERLAPRPASTRAGVDPDDAVLLAYGLSQDQEQQFDAADGKVSPFWELIGAGRDHVRLTVARNGSKGFSGPEDAELVVKAARGSAGLYLFFEASDDAWVEQSSSGGYWQSDTVDVVIDDRSSEEIYRARPADVFLNPCQWALTLTCKQIQLCYGGSTGPSTFGHNYADLWEMTYHQVDLADGKGELSSAAFDFETRGETKQWVAGTAGEHRGMAFDVAAISANRKVQEWFIPWDEVGAGVVGGEPDEGVRLALSVSYNDKDDPGAAGCDRLHWINRTSPWGVPGLKGPNPISWGDLEMGPDLTD